jgi:sec-independent protein translocase protein TatB
MASEFQSQFQEAMREAELADLKKQVDDMTSQAQSYANFDPVGEVRRELESTQQEIESGLVGEPARGAAATAEATAVETSPAPPALPSAETPSAAPSVAASEPATADAAADRPDAGDKPA